MRRTPEGMNATLIGRRMTPRYTASVGRFLFKAMLEFAYYELGADEAFNPKYDPIRRIALGEAYHGHLALARTADIHDNVSFTWLPLEIQREDAIWAQVDVYGVVFGMELLRRRYPGDHDPGVVAIISF
jgi:hypothetical protein